MRALVLLLFISFLTNCKAKSHIQDEQKLELDATECPRDGTCSFDILKNKNLKESKGTLGELYVRVVDGNKIVLKFEYKRNEIPGTVDGHYIEQVFIEIDKNNLEMQESVLKETNIMFARFCYCKGQTGYYKIKMGTLTIKKIKDNTYHLVLDFTIEEVPQIISRIEETLTL